MVEIIVNLVLEVVKCLAPRAAHQLGYLRNYKANFENLKAEIGKLKDERASIQRKGSEAERNIEKIEEKVENWLVSSNKIIDGASKFIEDEETATNKRCCKGLCPNLKTRYQLSKKAETKMKALVELQEESRRFDRISYPTVSEEIWLKSHKGYEAFESRLSSLNSIRNALTDPNESIIGVYGMGGIGKTTLVKEVARQAKEDMLFDQVVFSEVSQNIDIKKTQGEIAEKLGLVLHEEAESRRASRLYDRIKNEKKILVVLDNIWKHIDLENIGIPSGDDHKGCKILLTSRDRNVLQGLGSKANFLIGALGDEEAWRLFKTMADDDDEVEKCPLKSIATDVAKACGGLPIALATIARALRNKGLPEWKNALQEIRTPSIGNFEGVPAEAYSSIELSYKYLKGEQLKKTFLLCSLITPAPILDLFKLSMGMGLFQGVSKMENAHNKLYALVHGLIDSCLLLEGDRNTWFSMHDVVRDVANSIASRDKNIFLVGNEDVWQWPDVDTLKRCNSIHLRDISVHELPEGLECPQLECLYINSKEPFLEINIPSKFFTGMRKLRVVDLTRIQLFSLPSSMGLLVNLQTLCLEQSKLGDIAIIGKLKNLEVLSLGKSNIVQLPKELGQLTNLRLLDLTDCFRLKVIAPNVISSFTRLEELYMDNCFVEWEVDEPHCERGNTSLIELMSLSRLTTLEINVKDDNNFPEGFFNRNLSRFKISIGDESFSVYSETDSEMIFGDSLENFLIADCETLRTLKLKLSSATVLSKKLKGVKNVEYLCLDKLKGVKNVLFELDTEGFSQLKHLVVQNNPDFKCIVELMERVPFDPLPLLESLALYNLIELESICHDQLSVQSLKEFKTVKVKHCHALSNIFLLSAAKCLPRLQRIAVIDCRNMKGLFAIGGENDEIEKIEFPQFSTLSLATLPELISFCYEVEAPNRRVMIDELADITCSNEISLEDNLDTSTTLFNDKVTLPNLEALEMYEINVEKIWNNQLPIKFPHFQSLTRMILVRCHKLKYIFSASMVPSFKQLQCLDIRNCKGLREIISEGGGGGGADDQLTPNFVFPQLSKFRLVRLPELRCLYPGMHTFECPAIKHLEVTWCEQVKIFTSESFSFHCNHNEQPLFMFEKIFHNLEILGVFGKDMRMILQGNFPQLLFDRFKKLYVAQDDSASGFPFNLLERFHNLESLELSHSSYTETLSNGGPPLLANKDVVMKKIARIKFLWIWQLDSLKQLWKQDSGLDFVFQYLETLKVERCHNLSILLPPSSSSSSVSFRNITLLKAYGCKELKNLVTSSTAKGLVGLVEMKLCVCGAMTEVIKSSDGGNEALEEEEEEEEEDEEIVFTKLKRLTLFDLQSLTSFCSGGDYIFKFPSLQVLNVIGCPNMSIFTVGESSTPPTVDVWCQERDEGFIHWEGDLNTTIHNLHKRKLLEGSSSYSTRY